MATTQVAPAEEQGWMAQVNGFFRGVQVELRKVSWPTRDELVKATRMILVLSLVLGVLIGLMDVILQMILVDGVARIAGR
jgi:preprotein translocase subunit SecE